MTQVANATQPLVMDLTPKPSTPASLSATSSTPSQSASCHEDGLTCLWNACSQKAVNLQTLYEHVCGHHVGRKGTNNLSLICGWDNCTTTTTKRDQMTSHILVHIPLRPHKCDFCGKSFKRTQDLRKHVKTHADDSVLFDPGQNQHGGLDGTRATNDHSYYVYTAKIRDKPGYNGGVYAPEFRANDAIYFNQSPWSAWHSKPVGWHPAVFGGYDHQRALDAVEDFFGKASRHQVDPTSYAQIDRALISLRNLTTIPNCDLAAMGLYMHRPARAPTTVHSGSAVSAAHCRNDFMNQLRSM